MGDLADYLKKQEGWEKGGEALETAEKIAGYVSGVYGYYMAAKDLGAALGLWGGQKNQFEVLAEAIKQLEKTILEGFREFQQLARAEFQLQTRQEIFGVSVSARAAVATLGAHWDEPDEIDKPQLLSDTLKALLTLQPPLQSESSPYWQRTYYPYAAYADPWTGPVAPPGASQPGDWQWDYILALPAYLEALVCRLVVLRMLDPGDIGTNHKNHLVEQADRLKATYETILAGIRTLQAPTFEGAKCAEVPVEVPAQPTAPVGGTLPPAPTVPSGPTQPPGPSYPSSSNYPSPQPTPARRGFRFSFSAWDRARFATGPDWGRLEDVVAGGRLYGAYNVWSTESSVSTYVSIPPFPPGAKSASLYTWTYLLEPKLVGPLEMSTGEEPVHKWRQAYAAWYPTQVTARHAVRSLKHWKDVYKLSGLRVIWEVRNDLLRLVGELAEPLPDPSDNWSLREVAEKIPGYSGQPSLRTSASVLGTGNSLESFRET